LPGGHDAWVVGDEPAVVVDWFGASNYAKHDETTMGLLEVVEAFGKAWTQHDLDAAMAMTTSDCVFDATGPAPDGAGDHWHEAFLFGVPIKAGDRAQPPGHGGPGSPASSRARSYSSMSCAGQRTV
jgi:hypothetical protein